MFQPRIRIYRFVNGGRAVNKVIGIVGNIAAALGILACLVAGVARLFDKYYVANFETMVIFTLGVGLMVLACLAKLCLLESKT